MVRAAKEARIFPVVDVNAVLSPYVGRIKTEMEKRGYEVMIEKVGYEFQKGGE